MNVVPSAMTCAELRAWDLEWAMYGSRIWQHIGMRRGDIASDLRGRILDHLSGGRIFVASTLINNAPLQRRVDIIRDRYTRECFINSAGVRFSPR